MAPYEKTVIVCANDDQCFLVCYSIRKKLFRYIWENLKKCSSQEYPRKQDKMRQKYSQIVLKTEGFCVYERKIAFGGACGTLDQNNNKIIEGQLRPKSGSEKKRYI